MGKQFVEYSARSGGCYSANAGTKGPVLRVPVSTRAKKKPLARVVPRVSDPARVRKSGGGKSK